MNYKTFVVHEKEEIQSEHLFQNIYDRKITNIFNLKRAFISKVHK